MSQNNNETLFDVRTVERNLARGRMQRDQVDAYLGELEDCSEEAEWTTTRMSKPPEPEEDQDGEQ